MTKFLQKSFVPGAIALLLVCGFFVSTATGAVSSITINPATGGEVISADTTGTIYTPITGPVIVEGSAGSILVGNIILTAPTGFIFNSDSSVTATVTNGSCSGPGKEPIKLGDSSSQTTTPTANTITISVTQKSKNAACVGTITFTDIQVSPTAGNLLASGDLTFSGTAGVTGSAGTLTEVPGVLASINVSPVSPDPIYIDATQSFTATGFDQFNNDLSTLEVIWAINPGTTTNTIDSNGTFTAHEAGTDYVVAATADAVVGLTNAFNTTSDKKQITTFVFPDLAEGTIDEDAKTIVATIDITNDVTTLMPIIVLDDTFASVNPASEVSQDFTDPVVYTVTAHDGTTIDYTVTVTKSDQIADAFDTVATELTAIGVNSNLGDVDSTNIYNFTNLYFEKVDGEGNKLGRITFITPLDLSDEATKIFLQALGDKMEANPGIIGLEVAGSGSSFDSSSVGAEIKFYGLDQLGIADEATVEEVLNKIVAKDDLGTIIDKTDLINSEGAEYIGACGEGETECHMFKLTVNHFTQYEIDNTPPVVEGVEDGITYNSNDSAPLISWDEGTGLLNDEPFVSDSTVSTDGSYTLVVTNDGGLSTSINFSIDTMAPMVMGLENDITPTQGKTWNWSSDDPATQYRWEITSEDWMDFDESGEYPYGSDITATADANTGNGTGTYYLYVQAMDVAGNESFVTSVSVILDNQAPILQTAKLTSLNTIEVTFDEDLDGDALAIGDFRVDYADMTWEIASLLDNNGVVTLNLTNSLPDGTTGAMLVTNPDVPRDSIKDILGNEQFNVEQMEISDGIAPTATIEYSTIEPTNESVIATLVSEESITVINNGDSGTEYIFYENGNFTFEFTDGAGNTGTATATVNNIDKVGLEITLSEYTTEPTNQDITVTATANEGTLNEASHTFTENSSFTFSATDDFGNTTEKTVEITNIDKEAPTLDNYIGDSETDYELPLIGTRNEINLFGTSFVFNEELSETSRVAVEKTLKAGANKTLTLNWLSNRLRVAVNEETTVVFANDVYADLTDLAGNSTANVLLIDSALNTDNQAPVEEGDDGNVINLTADQEEGVINGDGDYEVNSGEDVDGGTLDVDPLTDGNNGTLPQITINSTTSEGQMKIEIPEGTTITGPADWDGTINIPTVKEISEANVPEEDNMTTTVDKVIEIGFGDSKLTFDKAVRIKFVGDAGKLVGYTRSGVFTEITTVCSSDSQAVGDVLPAEGDCYINVASDLIVWTKHFTKFVAFTQTAKASSGGGGSAVSLGGGGGKQVASTYQSYNPATGITTIGQPVAVTTTTPTAPATTTITAPTTTGQVLGTKTYADGTLLRNSKKQIFVIVNGQAQHVKSLADLAKYHFGKKINDVSDEVLQTYSIGNVLGTKTYADGSLLRNSKKQIFVIIKGQKQYVKNLAELAKNHKGKKITDVNDAELAKY